ncbi:MAG: hypothetical protein ACREDM_09925 [Methylocella sp.]
MGNRFLRELLFVGAHAVPYYRKPHEVLANKMTRIAFATMRGKTT